MNIQIERRAEIALRSLHGVDQKQVTHALHELNSLEMQAFYRHHKIHKVVSPTGETLYIYGGGMKLRLVLTIDGENCRVIDIVDHDRLGRLLLDRGQR